MKRYHRLGLLLLTAVVLTAFLGGLPERGVAQSAPTLPVNDLEGLVSLTGTPTPNTVPTQENPEPPLQAVPPAVCGPGSRPLPGEQGRVPATAISSPAAVQGWTCNDTVVSHYGTPGGFRVWRYVDPAGHACAFYDTSLSSALNVVSAGIGPSSGIVVLDMANPARPIQTAALTSAAMLAPHESLNLNTRRGLLAAEAGNGTTLPGLMSIYDVRQDCRHPVLDSNYLAAPFGHESGFAPDGKTFWIGGGQGIAAVDVSDPKKPHTIWKGNEPAHGLNLSDDGSRLYDADPIDGHLTVLNVSQVQARMPEPMVSEISRLTWNTVSIPQNTSPMQIHGKPYLLEFDEFAFRFNPATQDDQVGAARLIDLSDPLHPRVASNIRLAVNMVAAHKAADGDPSPLPSPGLNYAGHYCAIPREVDPEIVACSFINSGLRIFNIHDPLHPREIAYYISPPTASSNPGATAADFALSQPAFDPARREVWYTDATTGFYNLRLDPSVWVHPTGTPTSSPTGARTECLSGRTILIHLAHSPRIRSARVTIAGHAVPTRLAGRRGVRVSLRSLPKGAFTVHIIAHTRRGIRTTTRRYHTCIPRVHRQ